MTRQDTLLLVLSRIKSVDTGFTIDGEPSKCWLWQGALDSTGYGVIKINRKQVPVHRVVKHAPEGMELDHLCRTRNCVRPIHLEVVSQSENKRRANALRDYSKNKNAN